MSATELNHLIKMINQISNNIAPGEDDNVAAPKVADHIKRFWAPHMKQQVIEYAQNDGAELQPTAMAAISLLNN